jgi:predicted transcriptional regulator
VLFYIALCPRSTVAEIARAQGQTERAVWGIIRMLRRAGMVSVLKDGRRHRYIVNLDAPLLHPTIRGVTLRPILGELAARAEREPRRHCIDGG